MNHDLPLSKAIDGFMLELHALGRSQNTIRDYSTTLNYFEKFLSPNYPISKITRQDVLKFLASRPSGQGLTFL